PSPSTSTSSRTRSRGTPCGLVAASWPALTSSTSLVTPRPNTRSMAPASAATTASLSHWH
ncbi:hypothetical protein GGH95_006716, partial [Coemansia sp. RSA 1836]